jgi:lysyl-tRNA synthetase, class II
VSDRSWRADLPPRLARELRLAFQPIRNRWHEWGVSGFPLSIVSTLLVVLLWTARDHAGTQAFVDRISAVRLNEPILTVLARTPLSLFAPAYGLALAGAVAQVFFVTVIGEGHLGTKWTAVVMFGAQAIVNVVAAEFVRAGHASLIGIAAGHVGDRDTGPSVAVIAIAVAAAVFARTHVHAGAVSIGVLCASVLIPDRAGHEHLGGLILGAAFGFAVARRSERHDHHGRHDLERQDLERHDLERHDLQRHDLERLGLERLGVEPAGHPRVMAERRRTRRLAGTAVALAGIVALISATTRPIAQRLRVVVDIFSLATAKTANGVVAAAGVALLFLASGLRRGHRRAWQLSLLLLGLTAVGHVVKGGDIEESLLSLATMTYLIVRRDAFRARGETGNSRHALRALVTGLAGTFAGGVLLIEAYTAEDHHRMGAYDAAKTVVRDMRGRPVSPTGPEFQVFLRPALFGLGVTVSVFALWRAMRPAIARWTEGSLRIEEEARARQAVAAFGGGTLDYFALRHDKHYFFHLDSVVSYGVDRSVCLVSPDPIGPESERMETWAAFRRYADEQGWIVAVLAASQDWLPIYERDGMATLYVGDEGIVDVTSFDLSGGQRKSLRQAVNRVERSGYTVTFHNPATIDPRLRAKLRRLMTESRRGGVERGFSMTLGRIFDSGDTDLLLAVCTGPGGEPAAFCQYVPSPAVHGWSLDLMRRDLGEHPNGLLDFVLVETIRMLRDSGQQTLGLNFATMRAVLAGENGQNPWQRLQRFVLLRLSADMQIASLWRFNAKYGPQWQPRYVVLDGTEHTITVAIAMARAEGLWDIPVIGRWFEPKIDRSRPQHLEPPQAVPPHGEPGAAARRTDDGDAQTAVVTDEGVATDGVTDEGVATDGVATDGAGDDGSGNPGST